MRPEEIVPGASYRKGKTPQRVLTIKDQTWEAFLVEVTRNERGAITGHGKVLADPVVAVAERDPRGRVTGMLVGIDKKLPRALQANEGLRYRWVGGTVVYCPLGLPQDAKEMSREAFAKSVDGRVE